MNMDRGIAISDRKAALRYLEKLESDCRIEARSAYMSTDMDSAVVLAAHADQIMNLRLFIQQRPMPDEVQGRSTKWGYAKK
jgi:hypothetical protein